MPDLLILGIYPHAVEMADIVARINRVETTWNLVGFVSAFGEKVGEEILGLPVFDYQEALRTYPDALLIPEYDWPDRAGIPRDRLATLIDPSTFVSRTAQIGVGCIVYPSCYIGAHAKIGDLLFCLSGTVINHNDIIEDRVTLTSGVTLAGDVHLEADCYLGQSCSVRELLRIGRGSLIGMGAVVLKDVAPNSVMVGNPARRLRSRQLNFPGVHLLRAARQITRKAVHTVRRKSLALKASLGERMGPVRS